MRHTSPARRDPLQGRSLRFCAAAAIFFSLAIFIPRAQAQDQDVAEAARQEKARKAAQAKPENHVYTNDDLKRVHILTSEEQARVEARKKNSAAPPATEPPASLDATNTDTSAQPSLGEVARRFRREKAAREAERALQAAPRNGFPMNLSQPALASPAPLRAAPVSVATPSLPSTHSPVSAISGRRDPFSRPSRILAPAPSSRLTIPPAAAPPAITRVASPLALAPKSKLAATPAPIIAPLPSTKAMPAAAPRSIVASAPAPPAVVPATPARPVVVAEANAVPPGVSATSIIIQRGDSLWKLARRHFGSGARWPEWLAANPSLVDPSRIQPGSILLLPVVATNQPASPRESQVAVQPGDSLWKIASLQAGGGSRWPCLAQANPQLRDAGHIYPGQLLLVPPSCRLTSAAAPSPRIASKLQMQPRRRH